jgi:hypothetical protein
MFMQNLLGYAAIKGGRYSYYTSKALGYTALEDVAILGREPLLLREWAKLHANELLEIAGS